MVVKPDTFIQVKEEEEDDDSDSPSHFLGRSLSFTENGAIQQAIVAAAQEYKNKTKAYSFLDQTN